MYAEHFASWVSEPDEGQVDAINKGLRMATGEIVAWINSDDHYLEGAFSQVAEVFDENPDIGLIFGDVISIGAEGNPINLLHYSNYSLQDLMSFQIINQPAVFMRR